VAESEKVGSDIGFEAARVSWVVHHGANWHKKRGDRAAAIQSMVV